jgi:hypothetical protein
MVDINLLPWRNLVAARKQKIRNNIFLISAWLLIFFIGTEGFVLHKKIKITQQKISKLQTHEDLNDNQDEKLISVTDKITRLAQQQRFFLEKFKIIHAAGEYGITFLQMDFNNNKWLLRGTALNVSTLLRWQKSIAHGHLIVDAIKNISTQHRVLFSVTLG